MWINHWCLCWMTSAMPDIQLPSRPPGIVTLWLVANNTAWFQRPVCANKLSKASGQCMISLYDSVWSRFVKIEWWVVDVVICLEQSAYVCIWSSWCHCIPKLCHLLPHFNPDWFCLSGTGLPRLSWLLNRFSSSSSTILHFSSRLIHFYILSLCYTSAPLCSDQSSAGTIR